jgi:hypothetical protein
MKEIRKTEDGAIDNLLRAYAARGGGPQNCPEFDPDLANAYIEHKLQASERSRYEVHLSACGACRRAVVALARMSEADAPAYQPQPVIPTADARPGWLAGIKRAFGSMSAPQWAMAAAALFILAVGVPFLMSRNASRSVTEGTANNEVAQSSPAASAPNANSAASNYGGVVSPPSTSAAPASPVTGVTTQPPSRPQQGGSQQPVASDSRLASPSQPVAADLQARADQPKEKAEAKDATATADEAIAKRVEPTPAPPAAAPLPQPSESELGRVNPEEARRAQGEGDRARMTVIRPGRPDGGQRDSDRAIREEQPVAPPSTTARRSRSTLGEPSVNSVRPGRISESVRQPRTAERKVAGRKFWLRGEVWTDKEYNPNKKDMPVVTIIRDSDNYREVTAKHSDLKRYFEGFTENERVIVVYKGIVYVLVPQNGK